MIFKKNFVRKKPKKQKHSPSSHRLITGIQRLKSTDGAIVQVLNAHRTAADSWVTVATLPPTKELGNIILRCVLSVLPLHHKKERLQPWLKYTEPKVHLMSCNQERLQPWLKYTEPAVHLMICLKDKRAFKSEQGTSFLGEISNKLSLGYTPGKKGILNERTLCAKASSQCTGQAGP